MMDRSVRNEIQFKRHGEWRSLAPASPREMLLDHIRLRERATGAKEGCNEGDCGACTVVLKRAANGGAIYQAVNSCILLTGQIDGAELITIEDLARDGTLHPVQEAMVKHHASQCGFCTPGIVMSLFALYENTSGPVTRAQVLEALQGNLCRCTGYRPIIDAAMEACAQRPSRSRMADSPDVGPEAGGRANGPAEQGATIEPRPGAASSLLSLSDPQEGFQTGDAGQFFAAPASEDAFARLFLDHPDATIISGATDVGLWINKRLDDPRKIIWTGRIAGFDRIENHGQSLFIGARAAHAAAFAHLAAIDPDLGEVMRRFGSAQVRNLGTIGGNIANGSPIGDLAPCLIALGATLHLRRGQERRDLPLEAFFIAYGKQDRRPSEFVTGVTIPARDENARFRAFKLSKRVDEDISTVLMALSITETAGRVSEVRLAFGGMAATPKRATAAERTLLGANLARSIEWEPAITALASDFAPLTDMRASAAYRMDCAQALLRRALFELATPGMETRLVGARHG